MNHSSRSCPNIPPLFAFSCKLLYLAITSTYCTAPSQATTLYSLNWWRCWKSPLNEQTNAIQHCEKSIEQCWCLLFGFFLKVNTKIHYKDSFDSVCKWENLQGIELHPPLLFGFQHSAPLNTTMCYFTTTMSLSIKHNSTYKVSHTEWWRTQLNMLQAATMLWYYSIICPVKRETVIQGVFHACLLKQRDSVRGYNITIVTHGIRYKFFQIYTKFSKKIFRLPSVSLEWCHQRAMFPVCLVEMMLIENSLQAALGASMKKAAYNVLNI